MMFEVDGGVNRETQLERQKTRCPIIGGQMNGRKAWFAFFLILLLAFPAVPETNTYPALNPDLGVVYRPPSVQWDATQWDEVFRDQAPPMGWAVLPVGNEGCGAVNKTWLSNVKKKHLKLALLFAPFVSATTMQKIVDCAVPLGFTRAVSDEYVSYQTKSLNRPLCTVISEVRDTDAYIKGRYPTFEFGIDDNWGAWMTQLREGSNTCGTYPYFHVDLAGISVLSKYGNPSQKTCGHPTVPEMVEQIDDLSPVVRPYSRSGHVFVWELNQNWYPGGEDVLQFFRQLKPIHRWDPFLLFGPTTDTPREENWGYTSTGQAESCGAADYEWYLPARDYLVRISEGRQTSLSLQATSPIPHGGFTSITGNINAGQGENVQLQIKPANSALQRFSATVTAPSNARIAFIGARINSQLPAAIKGPGEFQLDRAQLFRTGSTTNLVFNSDFNDGFAGWLVVSAQPASIVNNAGEKSLHARASATQSVLVTSLPIPITGGRSYTINFDASILQEARNSGYFYISWNTLTSEISRARLFMKYPDRQTVKSTLTASDGTFHFNWTPPGPGSFSLFAFYPGTPAHRPAIASTRVTAN